jgi:hypothetical protein
MVMQIRVCSSGGTEDVYTSNNREAGADRAES